MAVEVEIRHQSQRRAGRAWWAWVGWALVALLLGAGFWLLLAACGIRTPHGVPLLTFCPASPARSGIAPEWRAQTQRQRALETEIQRLELALLGAPACPRAATAAEAAPESIPEQAWNRREVGFLEGCWALESDYRVKHVQTGAVRRVASWQVCFDRAGHGRQTLTFDDGQSCSGPMSGAFGDQGRLMLRDAGNVPCADNTFIYERHMTCERTDGAHAHCLSVSPDLDWPPVDVGFHRAAAP